MFIAIEYQTHWLGTSGELPGRQYFTSFGIFSDFPTNNRCTAVIQHMRRWYSGTPLDRTPLGPEEMSGLERCLMY